MADEMKQAAQDLEQLKQEFGIDAELYIPEPQDCCRHKHRSPSEYEALLKRLNRIEGQVRGVRGMVEKECYCTDILTQVSAINAALNAFNKELLSNHIHTCVVDDIKNGNNSTVDELCDTLQKLMK